MCELCYACDVWVMYSCHKLTCSSQKSLSVFVESWEYIFGSRSGSALHSLRMCSMSVCDSPDSSMSCDPDLNSRIVLSSIFIFCSCIFICLACALMTLACDFTFYRIQNQLWVYITIRITFIRQTFERSISFCLSARHSLRFRLLANCFNVGPSPILAALAVFFCETVCLYVTCQVPWCYAFLPTRGLFVRLCVVHSVAHLQECDSFANVCAWWISWIVWKFCCLPSSYNYVSCPSRYA